MKNEGLYVSLTPDGTIKKHLSAEWGEVLLPDTTVAEELIRLSEQNHIIQYQEIKNLWAIAETVESDTHTNRLFGLEMEKFLRYLKREYPIRYTLLLTQIDDQSNIAPFSHRAGKEMALFIMDNVSQAVAADITVDRVLAALSSNKPIDLEGDHFMVCEANAIVHFRFNGTFSTEYQFRSEEPYYIFLLQNFLCSEPKVACCQYCGRFFIPRSNRKTLYCDRIIRDGKSCKQVAPQLNRKERAAADRIISEYNRAKDMLIHRLDRAEDTKKASPIDTTREEYYHWLDRATAARDRYLAGELGEQEAWNVIHVPTIQEMRAKIEL